MTSTPIRLSSTVSRDARPLVLRGPVVVAVATTIVAIAQVLPVGFIRAVFTIPFVLLVPGWAAYLAIFGRTRPTDRVVGVTFVVALGMGVTILNGLVVNLVGWRLSEFSLLAGPAVIALVFVAVAHLRGADTTVRIPADLRQRFQFSAIVLCCSLAIGGGAVTYAAVRLPAPSAGAPFAELSFAPAFARADQPLDVVPGHTVLLPLQVQLSGRAQQVYRVFTFVDGGRVASRHATVIAPLWQGDVKIKAPSGRCLHQVQIVFIPTTDNGAKLVWLDSYLKVSTGKPCRS